MLKTASKKQSRQCDKCEVCCFVAEVKEGVINKPACKTCPFQKNGCTIFNKPERPKVCSTFRCAWLNGAGNKQDRPDKSHVMVSINTVNNGTWIMVMDLKKNAHKTTGKNIIVNIANTVNLPVIVVDHKNLKKGKGDFVIIKNSLKKRSRQLMGDYIENLSSNMAIYKLIVN